MGCLNSGNGFQHWFGNIHLSGPCNRSCYFCIGQHMPGLDGLNNLDSWPLAGMDEFLTKCREHNVAEVFLTGTDTEPTLFDHHEELTALLRSFGLTPGIRTNGTKLKALRHYDKGSVTVCSLDTSIHREMMGSGHPPDIHAVKQRLPNIKANIVLGPANVESGDVHQTIRALGGAGYSRINLREPYGQSHVGNPLSHLAPSSLVFGMPTYRLAGALVTYWDVHYCEVESVNLYASGRVSLEYPITKGHAPNGEVFPQSHFVELRRSRA